MVLSTKQDLEWNLGMFTKYSWAFPTYIQSCRDDQLLCAGRSAAFTSVKTAAGLGSGSLTAYLLPGGSSRRVRRQRLR